jgi:hypothetical protein
VESCRRSSHIDIKRLDIEQLEELIDATKAFRGWYMEDFRQIELQHYATSVSMLETGPGFNTIPFYERVWVRGLNRRYIDQS